MAPLLAPFTDVTVSIVVTEVVVTEVLNNVYEPLHGEPAVIAKESMLLLELKRYLGRFPAVPIAWEPRVLARGHGRRQTP